MASARSISAALSSFELLIAADQSANLGRNRARNVGQPSQSHTIRAVPAPPQSAATDRLTARDADSLVFSGFDIVWIAGYHRIRTKKCLTRPVEPLDYLNRVQHQRRTPPSISCRRFNPVGLRENKLLRSKLQVQAKNKFAGETQPSADEQLTRLEDDIRRLRIEFDIFFNGGAKRPPYILKAASRLCSNDSGDDRTLTYAQRYRYNSLAARYNAFRDLWRRTMQGREEGRDPVSAARASVKREVSQREVEPVSYVCLDAHHGVESSRTSTSH